VATWYGWVRVAGKWERLTGPVEGLGATARALDDEIRRRGLVVRSRDACLTSGAAPPAGVKRQGRRDKQPRPQPWEGLG
jgi:hypothetical protein